MTSRLMISLIVLAAATTACTGDGDTADPTSTSTQAPTTTVATTDVATTATATSTTPPPTTAPPTVPTTTPPTTAAPTTPAVTASTLPLPVPDGFTLEEVQIIDRDLREGFRLLYAAFADVNNEAAVEAALAYTTGDETSEVASLVEFFRTNNRRLELLPAPLESFEILQGPTTLTNGDVGLLLCHVAPYRSVEAPGGAGTTETVLNDSAVTELLSVDLRLEDGVWKRSLNLLDGQWQGAVRCPDAS